MSLAELYTRGVEEELKYRATWAPSVHLSLGDCGPVNDGIFAREANVRDWGITFEEEASPVMEQWSFNSDKDAAITFQTKGESKIPEVPPGKAGISIAFKADEAIVLAAQGGTQTAITNIYRLKQQVLAKGVEEGKDAFPEDFAVVTNLVTAASTTVLICEDSGGEYVASAEADFESGLVDLASVSLKLSVERSSKVKTQLSATAGATPLPRLPPKARLVV
jgi:hypothetical protein